MGDFRQPNTAYHLVFVFFFTLAVAARTTGYVNCQFGSLRYPFGFSDDYPIRFNCSTNGSAEIGDFAVEEVTNASIYVKIPPMCNREFVKVEQLFRGNFAPSNDENLIFALGCNKSSSTCSINPRFLSTAMSANTSCDSLVGCVDGTATKTTADVMSMGGVVNRTGCKYLLSSATYVLENNNSATALAFGRLRLDWWLKEGCSNTACSENANCTQIKLQDGGLGHRCTCLDGFHGDAFTVHGGCRSGNSVDEVISFKVKIGIGIASILFGLVVVVGVSLCLISRRRKTFNNGRKQNLKALVQLKHYSYAEVKKITKSFGQVVGKGGFGTVYRGTLSDGRSVAVKVLKDSKSNGEDFINEVASMSKTSHVNIVDLLGFCSEGSKKAILYEFLENGSLDRFISRRTSMNMDWKTLYNISLGIARGLEYLHHDCKARIVHFDIKPQNVLLDDNLCPKISDFGLAKLCKKKDSILSLLDTRGTIGYIAPEVFSRMYGRVSHKSDVYSYGMLVLEMVGVRNKERADQNSSSNASSMYFPEWIYKDLENGGSGRLIENGISMEEDTIAKKMTLVGLWCIQSSPSDRPPMNRVVEMMEGNLDDLQVPPRPVLQIPTLPLQESSNLSMDISV
ncbi:unnamed protein product [Microthlaspi erraticum]|uniref:Protein kinase domain-containing protein n=1 Tax=Microthlaspi erraticum TaxID=1685480 RepID=A0A6D2I4N6_9BRAS|nr:unnamed protein product [Microthlaspi erraticum]